MQKHMFRPATLVVTLCLGLVLPASSIAAVVINGITVSTVYKQLTISGKGFGTSPTVALGGTALMIVNITPTTIVAAFSQAECGTHRLVVRSGSSQATAWVAISCPSVTAQVVLTAQSEGIPPTALVNPQTPGLYRVSAYNSVLVNTETGGRMTSVIGWTDDLGPQTCPIASFAPGIAASLFTTCIVRLNPGTPLYYQVFADVSGGNLQYELFITVEQLQ